MSSLMNSIGKTLQVPILRFVTLSNLNNFDNFETNFFNFNNLFLDKGCGHKLTHTNKNEISINFQFVIKVFLLFCSAQD